MKISFNCDACGKSYSVSSELAGRKAKCKNCNHVIIVPQFVEPEIVAEIADDGEIHQPLVSSLIESYKSAQAPTPVVTQSEHSLNGTLASNPGEVTVNKLRYIRSYPKWFFIWHGSLLLSIGLCFVSLWFVPAVLFFGFCCYMYWKRIATQFRSGCANPAEVVSLDPPLIAAFTNLTKGLVAADVIKISAEPIAKFSTGMPTVGQKIPTVALYDDLYPESQHWGTFDPKPVNLVTNSESMINGVMSTFDHDDWNDLARGLAQIPKPFKPGHYRIYKPAEFASRPRPTNEQIQQIVATSLAELDQTHLFREITHERLAAIAPFVPAEAIKLTWGIVDAAGGESKESFVFTDHGIFYNFDGTGSGRIEYANLIGALSTETGLELMVRGGSHGQRIFIDSSNLSRRVLGKIDAVFDAIAGRND